jgi:tetratricopeptide (TPR) repeat protein
MKLYYAFILIVISLVFQACPSSTTTKETPKSNDTLALSDSLNLLNLAIEKDPQNESNYLRRANYFLNHQQYKEVVQDIDFCLKKDSTNPELLLLKVESYYRSGNEDKASETLKYSIKYNQNHLNTQLKYAELKFILRDYNVALNSANEALRIDVNNAKAYFIKGMIFKEKGDTAKAISSFITATEQNTDYHDAYIQIGTLQAAKNAPGAIKFFENALKVKLNSEDAWMGIALYYQKNDTDPRKALNAYRRVLNINPNNVNAHYNLGAISYLQNDYLKASNHFSDAINADSTFFNSYFARGVCYKRMNYPKEAKRDLEKFLKFSPEDQETINQLKGL